MGISHFCWLVKLYSKGGVNIHMYRDQRIWQYFQQHRAASILVAHISVVAVLGVVLLSTGLGTNLLGAFAQSRCSSGDRTYIVASGDTLGGIGAHYKITWQRLASYNHIANPNLIYVNQTICIPGKAPVGNGPPPVKGHGDYFPYPQCTWWASHRYYELRHIYVPWTTQSDAWQWSDRARNFHWHVSSTPSPGAIINLQPWVQGAYGLGHVAVVERILGNGDIIGSNLNWGAYPEQVTYVEFSPGPGVTFISY